MSSGSANNGWVVWAIGGAAAFGLMVVVTLVLALRKPSGPEPKVGLSTQNPVEPPKTDPLAEARAEEARLTAKLKVLTDANFAKEAAVSERRKEVVDLQSEYETLTGQPAPM